MKTSLRLLATLGVLAAVGVVSAEDIAPVIAPNVRKDSLAKAEALLSQKPLGLPANAKDPFHSDAFAEATGHAVHPANETATVKAGPRSEHDVLVGIASGLKPTGNFVIAGEETLFFGQKRVKPGSTLTINFEGAEYIVEITAIDHTSFTLRLNREEYTRPIK
jgi:hypothetical protein